MGAVRRAAGWDSQDDHRASRSAHQLLLILLLRRCAGYSSMKCSRVWCSPISMALGNLSPHLQHGTVTPRFTRGTRGTRFRLASPQDADVRRQCRCRSNSEGKGRLQVGHRTGGLPWRSATARTAGPPFICQDRTSPGRMNSWVLVSPAQGM